MKRCTFLQCLPALASLPGAAVRAKAPEEPERWKKLVALTEAKSKAG